MGQVFTFARVGWWNIVQVSWLHRYNNDVSPYSNENCNYIPKDQPERIQIIVHTGSSH